VIVGVLALQGDFREHAVALERLGAAVRLVRTVDHLAEVDGSTVEGTGQVQLGVLDVVVRRNAFGRQVDSFEADISVVGLEEPVHGVFIRAPWIEKVGAGIDILAEVDGRAVMVRQGSIIATSFHPELTADGRLHTLLLDMIREG